MDKDPSKNVGSLLRLFKSSFFDTWLCIAYLYRYSSHQGIVDYLCNELYRLSSEAPDDIDFYVTQLCILLVHQAATTQQQTSLERFMLDQCSRSIRFAVKACWIFQGFVQDRLGGDPNDPILLTAIRLREFCEIACVNSKRPNYPPYNTNKSSAAATSTPPTSAPTSTTSSASSSCEDINTSTADNTSKDGAGNEEDLDVEFWQFELTKKDRADYFNGVLGFVDRLQHISQRLTQSSPDTRQEKLVHEIRVLNIDIPSGLYLPMWRDSHSKYHCIVRIPPEDSRVLNSRERVPFMLSIELLQSTEDVTSKDIHNIATNYYAVVQNTRRTNPTCETKEIVPSPPASPSFHSRYSPGPPPALSAPSPPAAPPPAIPFPSFSPASSPLSNNTTPLSSLPHSYSAPALSILEVSTPTPAFVSPFPRTHTPPPAGAPTPPVTRIMKPHSNSAFGVVWEDRVRRVKKVSPFGVHPEWNMCSVIVKSGDDLRQEQLATQLITQFKRVWVAANLPLWLRCYEILVTSATSGIIETIPNSLSLHHLKKNTANFTSLLDFMIDNFGEVDSESFKTAQRNFVESMAAYSIVCYILQVKDRHNGNILLDTEGHIIHIDFGFMLSNSPGNMYFESAPFKLTQEFVDVMGGIDNRPFQYFKALCIRGFLEARKHMEQFVTLVEMMMTMGPTLPSFIMGPSTITDLKARFNMTLTERECVSFVEGLITESLDHFKTRAYDKYQSYVNGILP